MNIRTSGSAGFSLTLATLLLSASVHAATFGDQTAYTGNFSIRDVLAGAPASPPQSGDCDSITAYLKVNLDSCKIRCALYTISGSDTVLVANGITEERRFAANASFFWHGFAFADPKPQVIAGAAYFIAAFGDTAGTTGGGLARVGIQATGGTGFSRNSNYESGFPNPLNPASPSTFKIAAYVTYTPISEVPPRRRIVVRRGLSSP